MPQKKGEPKVKGIAQADKTVLKSLALGGLLGGGGECVVDVKDGKAVRIRPFHYDWKYDKKQFNPWKINEERPDSGTADEISALSFFSGL